MNAGELKEKANAFGLKGEAIEDVNEVADRAKKNSSPEDMKEILLAAAPLWWRRLKIYNQQGVRPR